jgi:hypothetical protein
VEIQFHSSLTSALGGGEWLDSHLAHFTPGKRTLAPTGYEAGWVSRAGLNAVEKRKIFVPVMNQPSPRCFGPWRSRYTD